ncbi:MAG: hypothetical protein PHS14_05085 [Elusimicrobia bacterium]|nr:hypothetical protein [Elusimicrobiota bacterium]
MEIKTLSSSRTFVMKVIVPAFWIFAFGAGTVLLWLNVLHGKDGSPPPDAAKWAYLAAWVSGSAFLYRVCGPLKTVRLGGGTLLVSNYLKEISIPASQIAEVTENRWINIHPVTIRFRQTTEFGDTVTFMPRKRDGRPWRPHPVVEELVRASSGR